MALKTVKLEPGAPRPRMPAAGTPGRNAAGAPPQRCRQARLSARGRSPSSVALAGLAAIWFGGDWLINGRFEIRTDNAFVRADITRVTPKVQGYVTSVHVNDNQAVKAGDLLISLEAADFQARVAEAKAALAQAEADAAQARARIAAQRDTLAEARAAREAADASADWADSDAKRMAELAEKGWAAKARVEQLQAAERTAKAQLDQADASVTAQRSQLTVRRGRRRFGRRQGRSRAGQARRRRTRPRPHGNPRAGRWRRRQQERHRRPAALAQPGRLWRSSRRPKPTSIANFKETQVAQMKPGQCVNIHVDAYPSLQGEGQGREPRARHRRNVQPRPAGHGDRQLHQDRAARARAHRARQGSARPPACCASGLAVVATVSTKPNCE